MTTFFFLSTAYAQNAGSIDRNYAVNGFNVFTLASTPTVDRPIDLMNAGNGKLYFLAYDNNSRNAYIGRLDSNGNKDLTFNQGVFPIPSVTANFFPILVKNKSLVPNATDTSVIVISTTGNNIITLHKFNDHGNYDPAFGVGGKVQVTLNKSVLDMPKALYLPDGKILVLIGSQNSPSNSDADVLVVRLQANGALDNTFGVNGITTIDQITSFCTSTCFPSRDFAKDMIYTDDGKIIVTGSLQGSASNDYGAVFRLNADGSKDLSFGSGGIFTVFSAGWKITPVSIKEQGDKFLVSYNRWNPLTGVRTSNLVRYNISNGSFDGTFQSIAIPQIAGSGGGSGVWGIVDILVQQDRKINVLCVSTTDATGKPYVVRLQRKGAIDPVFGTNGITIIDTLSILPAIDIDEIVLSHFDCDLQGRLNLVTSANYSTTRDVLFTRLHIGALSGLIPPVANAGPDQAVCVGTVSIGTPAIDGLDYSWTSIPAGYISAVANPNVTVNSTTTYILSVTNAFDEVMKDSVTISTLNNVSITAPGGTNFCGGSSLTLISTSASGNQWFKDNVLISGAISQSYIVTQTGSYTVSATSASCSGTSSAVVVTNTPTPATPVITAGGPLSFCAGGNVVLSSSASTGNQWYKGGVAISGSTGQNYTATQSGIYTVKVTVTGCASAISQGTTVTVNSIPPRPNVTPTSSIIVCEGGTVGLLSSSASGNQWYKDGVLINGATGQNYTATQGAVYTVIVTINGCVSPASFGQTVYVNSNPPVPTITAGGPISFCTGGSVVLSSSAVTGNQWYKDGVAISGATAQNYTATQAATYTVKVTINNCASTSLGITVTDNSTLVPTITAGGPISFCTGGSVVLSSSAASGNQWYKDGIAISGETGQNYTATLAATYTVKVTANGCVSNFSAGIAVIVNNIPATPAITAGGPTSFCNGGNVVLSSSVVNGNQWYKDGIAISGETGQNYTATLAATYTTRVTFNGCVSNISNGLAVTVNSIPNTPTVTQSGSDLVSSAPAGNQWYNNGVAISNATSATYTPTISGNYTVTTTINGCTSAASAPFNLVITAINSPTLDERILIAPNPVSDQLIIKYNGNSSTFQLKMTDMNGKSLIEKTFTNSTTIDVRSCPSGILILLITRIRTGEHVQKLVVKF